MKTEQETLSHLVASHRAEMELKALEGHGHAIYAELYWEQREVTDHMNVQELREEYKTWRG